MTLSCLKGSLEGLGDIRILLLRNHLFAYTNRRGLKLALILSLNGSVKANTSYAPKIGSYLILLRSGHLGGCLWCEGEGLPLCAGVGVPAVGRHGRRPPGR